MSAFNAPIPQSPDDTHVDRSTEPSMEDILASIRRIIADDQSRSVGGGAPALRHGPLANGLVEPQATREDDVSFVPPQTPHLHEREAILDMDAPQPHINVPSLRPSYDDGAQASMMDEIASMGAAAMDHPRAEPAVGSFDQPEQVTVPLKTDDHHDPVGAQDHGSGATMQMSGTALANGYDEGAAAAEPLVSVGAGASVGSSLQALASSVLLQNADTVEQMTRDMLRPMLKDWLDDNLPTIVERLVRIEIERVARGR